MAQDRHPETPTGRVVVPAQMIYRGQLPEELGPQDRRPQPEDPWRNVALTVAVVLVIGVGALAIFRKQLQPDLATATWENPVSTTTPSPTPTDAPLYTGPSPSGIDMPRGDLPGWRQTFAEDFNGADLRERWYLYDGQPNGDPGGWFMPSHVSQSGGRLIIRGSRENTPNGNIYATGGISNSRSFSQTYGKFSVRFRMDEGWGINYVLLLWPTDDRWPPELNFAEDYGKGRTITSATVHYGGHGTPHRVQTKQLTGYDFTQWHTVGTEWTPAGIRLLIDDQEWGYWDGRNFPVPNTPMSLAIQSQAWYCGGTFSDCPNATTPPVVNLEVDWAVAYAMA